MYVLMVSLYFLLCLVCGVLIWILARMMQHDAFDLEENMAVYDTETVAENTIMVDEIKE